MSVLEVSCGPDFLCIGAQKAGTTWLYKKLGAHPQVVFPGPKEVHFWDEFYARGLDWYRSLYEHVGACKAGDITPAYAILPKSKIRQIYELNSAVPIVFIMRNPLERAWSLALMNLKQLESCTFEGQSLRPDHMADDFFRWQMQLKGSRRRSDYYSCLSNWFEVFPRDQFLIMDYADLSERPRVLLEEVSNHIGVSETFWGEQEDGFFNEKVFSGGGYPLRRSLRSFAVDLYRDEIDRLSELLGKDYSGWYRAYMD